MKRYQIAGLAVDMEITGRTEAQAEPYRVSDNGPADITLTCDARRVLELNPQMQTLEVAQYLGSGAIFARHLLKFNGTYLHASAVILDGKAYLFSANSGTGKSTHTEKWCRLFGATYLNDDKPALRLVDGVWMAYGTPWSGKHDLSTPAGVPLGGIAFLKRGEENAIRPMPSAEAVPHILHQSQWKLQKDQMQTQLDLVDKLMRQIPVWELTCRNDDAAAILSHSVMTKAERT
ncbi:MAG: hypothetical protein IJX37_10400 [Oscillospiraceae bacterium]|nr:hypothetical protein [Oscillospiraceae bacterium]